MNEMTWLSIVILGPGAIGVFVWFLKDVRGMLDTLQKKGNETRSNDFNA